MNNLKHGDEIRRCEMNSSNKKLIVGQIYKFDKYASMGKEQLHIIGDKEQYFTKRFEKVSAESSKFISPTDWKQFEDGMEFTAKIKLTTVIGKISINKADNSRIYLCQNTYSGNKVADKKGYDYSWELGHYRFTKVLSKALENDSISELLIAPINSTFTTTEEWADVSKFTRFDQLVHGIEFQAITASNIYCSGKISTAHLKDGKFHLCQDVKDGQAIVDKFGYKYSYAISSLTYYGSFKDLKVKISKLISSPINNKKDGKESISVKVQGQISTISIGKRRSGSSISSGRIKSRVTVKHLGYKEVNSF